VTTRIWFLALVLATLVSCQGTDGTDLPENDALPVCPSFLSARGGLPDRGEWRSHPSVADVNGDGLDDMAALPRKMDGPRVFLSDGLGSWTEGSEGLIYERGFSCGVGTRLADLDADGSVDLLLADHCDGVYVYRGDGNAVWTEDSRGIPRNMEGFNDADYGDLDGDGHLDIVAVSAFTRGFLVLHGRRDGSYKLIKDSGLPRSGSGWQVLLEDVNLDGRLDVVSSFNPTTTNRREEPSPPAKVWLQTEDGRFRPTEGFPAEGRYFGLDLLPKGPGRVPGLVLGVFGYHAGLYLYESEDGEHWKMTSRLDEEWFGDRVRGFAGVTVEDINEDGCPDVLASEGSTQSILVAVGDCEGHWHLCPEGTLPRSDSQTVGWGLATGDINADGRLDVVSAHGSPRGSLRAWVQVDAATAAAALAQGQGLPESSAALAPASSEP
jgi:hypothetical protein